MANGSLRVLPLGGLGEIGKNMTVFEYEDRIVVVDVGLRFPTADMLGIDLVLPDFAYLRERADQIEAIVITHGHEDHLGALPWVIRELRRVSKPGRRIYKGVNDLPSVYNGLGIAIVSTPRGVLSDTEAREARVGGEVLCTVF